MSEYSVTKAPSSSSKIPAPRFTVQTAEQAWPQDTRTHRKALCNAWIEQSQRIEESEQKSGSDPVYCAWAVIYGLNVQAMSAYQAARESSGQLTGTAFAARFVSPALSVLSEWEKCTALAKKDQGVTSAEVSKAEFALAAASKELATLSKLDFGSVAAISREDGHEDTYWIPLLTALNESAKVLNTLCPRMMGVRNAATTCGLMNGKESGTCTVLRDDGEIRAIAMWTLDTALFIDEITVEPEALQKQARGIGGALIEYLIRQAAAAKGGAGVPVTLDPIDDLARKIYTRMGFEPSSMDSGARWVMRKPAQEAYLKKYTSFAPSKS